MTPNNAEKPIWLTGIELRGYPDGMALAVTPSGRIFRIEDTPAAVYHLLKACDGAKSVAALLEASPNAQGFSEVIDELLDAGALCHDAPDAREPRWARFRSEAIEPGQLASTRIALIGDTRLTALIANLQFASRFGAVDAVTAASLEDTLRKHEDEPTVVLALREQFDYEFLIWLNDLCESRRVRWAQFHIEQGRGWLGPAIVPGSTPDYRDLMGRRLSVADNPGTHQALISPTLYGKTCPLPDAELIWMIAYWMIGIERWIAGAEAQCVGNEVEADPVSLTFNPHPVLPLPHRRLDGKTPINFVKHGQELICDDRTGIITNLQTLEHHPSIPASLTTVQSQVADMGRLYCWANNTVCSGSTFGDYASSRTAAVGEGLERYCGNWVSSTEVVMASYDQLRQRGEYALDPMRLILYSENQYNAPGFPFVRFTRDLKVHWVQGRSLTANRSAWIPASLIYINWYTGEYAGDPFTNFLYYPGLAAGPTLDIALSAGIEEVIERHATMAWWANAHPLPAVKLEPELAALWEGVPYEMGQRAWLIHLDNEFNVPVFAGVVENIHEKLIHIGFDAHADPIEAARKAWTEALTLQDGSRDLLDPNGLFWEGVALGQMNGASMKPWRADRAYLDDYRPDFKDINDLRCQQQVFLDPRAREVIRPWVDVPATRAFDELPRLKDRTMASFREPLEKKGYEIFYVDVTMPDVEVTGFKVARVIVPGLVPNYPAGFPFLGQARLQNMAVELGWRKTPLAEEVLNYFPMPHA